MLSQHNVTLEILTENGNPVTVYSAEGKSFIEGRKNSNFKVRIRNNNYFRVQAIISIDGLDIIDGKPASYNSRGYIIPAHQQTTIDGWRISNEEVRKFFFTSKSGSYSSKAGEGSKNCGVIGLLVFNEKVSRENVYRTPFVNNRYDSNTLNSRYEERASSGWGANELVAFASATGRVETNSGENLRSARRLLGSAIKSPTLGTGMGDVAGSKVQEVNFTANPTPFVSMEVFYYTRRELERMGVITKYVPNRMPTAFPGQYCKQV